MDFHVIKVPAPKEVGKVNCILIDAEKPVLIDPGPDTEEGFKAVVEGLKQNNIKPESIEKVLITHPHSDHFGNARRIKQVSGSEIYMHQKAAEIVEEFEIYKKEQIRFFSSYFQRMGLENNDIETALEKGLPNSYKTDLELVKKLQDGDKIGLGNGSLTCVEVEGHAKGSMCFKLNEENIFFTGDFILPDITPNPMLMLPEEGSRPPSSLRLYLNSLKSFEADGMSAYGGHEGPIEDIDQRIKEMINHHQDRKEKMLAELKDGMTAFQLMEKFFGELPENQYYLGMAEVIAHLRLLEEEEKVRREEKDFTVFFKRA